MNASRFRPLTNMNAARRVSGDGNELNAKRDPNGLPISIPAASAGQMMSSASQPSNFLGFLRKRFRQARRLIGRRASPLSKGLATIRWWTLDRADRAIFDARNDARMIRELSLNRPVKRQLIDHIYIDVSVIENNDAGTGIQRVVRSLREHLPAVLAPSVRAEQVITSGPRSNYVARDGSLLVGAPGKLFLGLDFSTDAIYRNRHQLLKFKREGGSLWFLLHDILPLSHPQWFTTSSRVRYRRWLRVCAALADGFLCVSPVVASDLKGLLAKKYRLLDVPRVAVVQLGSDITSADRKLGLANLPTGLGLDSEVFEKAALVVGTLEPRKGHADVLDAYDQLWAANHQLPLVLIGRPGWNTVALQSRIRNHPQHGRLLFWLENVDDRALHAAYSHSRLVIVPSLAEGYGLPMDEALALGAAVLARDIPVFRRHNEEAVSYFPANAGAETLAAQILAKQSGEKPRYALAPLRQWEETARQVARELECGV